GLLLQGVSGALNEKQQDSMQRINRAGNHLLGLISDVIDISKIEAGRIDAYPEQVSLKEVVEDAVESIRPLADAKGLKLEVSIDDPEDSWPEMTTDRKRLMQCLLNYLSNAVKFTEQGMVTLTVSVNGDRVEISVTDTGIGISEKDLPRLFEAFERLDTHLRIKAGGTGLGLYLTKKIAYEILHGSVSVESRINEGSTFRLEFPVNSEN
ncbi:MAG TPA: HAMP domain-containing histidine kinase, partial [Ectothiorhodospiraceae bacterium]|nr:HAMP domain-containing histidine kinase [Ectothiorhodospiraceae bacterium]